MAKTNLKDIQYAFTAHLRDPENNPAPEDIEDRRMGIYRDLFYNNVEGFLSKCFPVIRSIYNDKNWHRMARDFFSRHKSQSPYFLEISQEFLAYLQNERKTQPEDPAGLQELAHYEWIELALNVSDETIKLDDIDVNGDLLAGHPVLSPLACSLSYQFPVHKMATDFLPEQPPEQASHLMVYRNRNDEVKFMEINPVTARLIYLLENNDNMTGQQALQQITEEMQHPNPEVVINGGLTALQELQGNGVILGTRR
ncbi:MAG: putative DNA-binding domain-containing protein [Gammaproteobacteria bacterium]|nr:putative DNA-binding domain-containing protein [Gammaproteobacteria bacterium]